MSRSGCAKLARMVVLVVVASVSWVFFSTLLCKYWTKNPSSKSKRAHNLVYHSSLQHTPDSNPIVQSFNRSKTWSMSNSTRDASLINLLLNHNLNVIFIMTEITESLFQISDFLKVKFSNPTSFCLSNEWKQIKTKCQIAE